MTVSFRPRTGDYFFIVVSEEDVRKGLTEEFPSPYWGLFFYRGKTRYFGTTWLYLFPSPYWGLFFYHGTDWIN